VQIIRENAVILTAEIFNVAAGYYSQQIRASGHFGLRVSIQSGLM